MKPVRKKLNPTESQDDEMVFVHKYIQKCDLNIDKHADEFYKFSKLKPVHKKEYLISFFIQTFNVLYAPFYIFLKDTAFWFEEMGYKAIRSHCH